MRTQQDAEYDSCVAEWVAVQYNGGYRTFWTGRAWSRNPSDVRRLYTKREVDACRDDVTFFLRVDQL